MRARPVPDTRCGGYVLLMILLLLPVAAVAMAGVVRLSLHRAVEAQQAEQQLQVRWALRSAQQTLGPQMQQALEEADRASPEPVAGWQGELVLAGRPMTIVLFDEQAKVNLNALVHRRGPDMAQEALRTLMRRHGTALPLALRPLARPSPETSGPRRPHLTAPSPAHDAQARQEQAVTGPGAPAYTSFGQIFAAATPEQLLGRENRLPGSRPAPHGRAGHLPGDGLPGAGAGGELPGAGGTLPGAGIASDVTVWGDGRIHFRRASRAALLAACAPVLGPGEVEQIVQLRQQQPGLSLTALLNQLQLEEQQRATARALLTDQSRCHSLWLTVHGEHRRWHRLTVASAGRGGSTFAFTW